MTNLKCSVTNCINNKDHLCVRHDITVDGRTAHTVPETCCHSFGWKEDSMQNFAGETYAQPATKVLCNAKNCTYNEDSLCVANEISISGRGASDCQETTCDTFECR